MSNSKKISFLLATTLFGGAIYAEVPKEGSVIGNQATATYKDGSGESKTATSNLVETTVAKISGVSITSDQAKTVSVGGTILFQHTIENTGNGVDSYNLSYSDLNSGNINFSSLLVYPDADQNGVPDSTTPITVTPNIESGSSYGVIISATIPNTASHNDSETISITATSVYDNSIASFNTDTINVTGNAVVDVTKSLSVSSGASPSVSPITVTLTYTNTGDSTASDILFEDTLPAGMTYVSSTGNWSGVGSTLTDADDGDEGGIEFNVVNNVISGTIDSIASGSSGIITFQVTIDSDVAPGSLTNFAEISYDDGSGDTVGPVTTNGATYTVLQTASLVINDKSSTVDEDGSEDDVITISTPVSQGETLLFDNTIINNGNGSDTFELSIESGDTFPTGTVFQFFKSDGATPLSDTNADGNPDTGLLDSDEELKVYIKVILPSDYFGDTGFDFFTKATSKFDGTISDTVKNTLVEILESKVDLTNDVSVSDGATSTDGLGDGAESTPVRTISVDPSGTATFSLVVSNLSAIQDNYEIEVSTDPTFTTTVIPTDWTIELSDGTSTVTDTGSISANSSEEIFASITVPSTATPVDQPLYFRVISSITGASDIIYDQVTVNTVVDVSLSPNNTGQIFPGGTAIYTHVLNNNGNVSVSAADLLITNTESAWNSLIYLDDNGNGEIDSSDPTITSLSDLSSGIDAGSSITLLVKVFAPSGADEGSVNTTTITIANISGEVNLTDNYVSNVTTIISGDVTLEKKQAIDADCNGEVEGVLTGGQLTDALPGYCIVYEIVATNTGSASVNDLVINDTTPAYTTYTDCSGVCSAVSTATTITTPVSGEAGVVSVEVGDLDPTGVAILSFTVKIDE